MDKIHTMLVLEILGKPKDHVSEALTGLVEKLGNEKGVEILKKTLHEPILTEGSEDLFTTFAEIEVEFAELSNYFGILFTYMPSNIEIIRPEKLTLANSNLNDLGNTITQKLHHYDAITKKALMEREILLKKLQEHAPEEFKKLTTPPEEEKKN